MAETGTNTANTSGGSDPDAATMASRLRPWTAPPAPHRGPVAQATELKDLVVAYAKQETIEPLKTLQRYLSFGLAGAVAIGAGLCFLLLALLRGLQEYDLFNDPSQVDGGTWSWVPYAITGLVGVILAAGFLVKLYRFTQQGAPR